MFAYGVTIFGLMFLGALALICVRSSSCYDASEASLAR